MSIEHINHLPIDNNADAVKKPGGKTDGPGFGDMLKDYINDVNSMQNEMDHSISKMATGEVKDLHQVMLAVEKADLSFRLMMEVRNKLIKAYEEVMKM